MEQVNLLVCLSYKASPKSINELLFYNIVNQFTPVLNVRMISKKGQAKAFVQIANSTVGESVITELNGKRISLGKIKVFLSHKSDVIYEKPLELVLRDARIENVQLDFEKIFYPALLTTNPEIKGNISNEETAGTRNLDQKSRKGLVDDDRHVRNVLKKKNNVQNKEKSVLDTYHNGNGQILETRPYDQVLGTLSKIEKSKNHYIKIVITNDNYDLLKDNVVTVVFRCIGKILNLKQNLSTKTVTINLKIYKSSISNQFSIDHIKLYGYNIIDLKAVEKPLMTDSLTDNSIYGDELVRVSHCTDPKISIWPVRLSKSLKVVDLEQNLDLLCLCRQTNNGISPRQIIEGYDLINNQSFFLVMYKTQQQALGSFISLISSKMENIKLKVSFIDFDS